MIGDILMTALWVAVAYIWWGHYKRELAWNTRSVLIYLIFMFSCCMAGFSAGRVVGRLL